jgi:hypothetical protein
MQVWGVSMAGYSGGFSPEKSRLALGICIKWTFSSMRLLD